MKLLFKQRLFSWFDSYDVYDENGNTIFTVAGKLSWGHRLEISDALGNPVGTVKEEPLALLPRFALTAGGQYLGELRKRFTLLRPVFTLDYNGWVINGDYMSWDYCVTDGTGDLVMRASKELFRLTDTYVIDVIQPQDALVSLMIVLSIDAAKCSAGS